MVRDARLEQCTNLRSRSIRFFGQKLPRRVGPGAQKGEIISDVEDLLGSLARTPASV